MDKDLLTFGVVLVMFVSVPALLLVVVLLIPG